MSKVTNERLREIIKFWNHDESASMMPISGSEIQSMAEELIFLRGESSSIVEEFRKSREGLPEVTE